MSKERVSFSSLKNKMAKFVCVTRRCCANLFQGHIPKALKASVSHIVMQNHFEHPLPKIEFTPYSICKLQFYNVLHGLIERMSYIGATKYNKMHCGSELINVGSQIKWDLALYFYFYLHCLCVLFSPLYKVPLRNFWEWQTISWWFDVVDGLTLKRFCLKCFKL